MQLKADAWTVSFDATNEQNSIELQHGRKYALTSRKLEARAIQWTVQYFWTSNLFRAAHFLTTGQVRQRRYVQDGYNYYCNCCYIASTYYCLQSVQQFSTSLSSLG